MSSNVSIGAASELEVAVVLLKEGYEVFRNVGRHGTADTVIRNRNTNVCKTVEVRTAKYGVSGNIYFPKKQTQDNADYYGLVIKDSNSILFYKISTYPNDLVSIKNLIG